MGKESVIKQKGLYFTGVKNGELQFGSKAEAVTYPKEEIGIAISQLEQQGYTGCQTESL